MRKSLRPRSVIETPVSEVLQLDDLLLEAAELLLAVSDVVALGGEHVVVAGRASRRR